MSETDPDMTAATTQARRGLRQSEAGERAGVERVEEARRDDPAAEQAAEQEASDGPDGRGLSR